MSIIVGLCSRQGVKLAKGLPMQQLRMVPGRWLSTTSCLKSTEAWDPEEDFWGKNKRLKRPMSPHLTIYKPQLTSLLSVSHRGTGLALSTVMSGFAIGMLALPNGFAHYYGMISCTPGGAALIFGAKFCLAFPFMFHFLNGIRHLVWDLGHGFKIPEVYTTGYVVSFTSLLLASAIAAM